MSGSLIKIVVERSRSRVVLVFIYVNISYITVVLFYISGKLSKMVAVVSVLSTSIENPMEKTTKLIHKYIPWKMK